MLWLRPKISQQIQCVRLWQFGITLKPDKSLKQKLKVRHSNSNANSVIFSTSSFATVNISNKLKNQDEVVEVKDGRYRVIFDYDDLSSYPEVIKIGPTESRTSVSSSQEETQRLRADNQERVQKWAWETARNISNSNVSLPKSEEDNYSVGLLKKEQTYSSDEDDSISVQESGYIQSSGKSVSFSPFVGMINYPKKDVND